MTYEYTGIVEAVGQTETVGQKGFRKREIVVGNDIGDPSKYPSPKKFTFKQDKAELLDGFRKGQRVKILFALDGRRWDGPRGVQYFVDLTGLKVEAVAADGGTGGSVPAPAEPERVDYRDVEDEMPF